MDDHGSPSTPVVFQPEGSFDAAAAWAFHDALREIPTTTPVIVDFRNVRDCHDFAIALLAQEITSRTGRVSLLGLTHHQQRLLRYFGVEEATLRAPAGDEAYAN